MVGLFSIRVFVSQFDLVEPNSGRRARLNDLIFVAYLGMEPESYGVIRVPQDTNLEDRFDQKVPGTQGTRGIDLGVEQ